MQLKIKNNLRLHVLIHSIIILCISNGCTVNRNQEDTSVIFSLKTTSCMGQCPVYEFKVFEGKSYVFTGESKCDSNRETNRKIE